MDRLDELAVLTAILDAGSLAGAAKRLRRSASAVTRLLAVLEERVGLRLVERTTRRLAPTEAGSALAERARALLADYNLAVRETASRQDAPLGGTLAVTAPFVFGRRHVAPVAATFLDQHPGLRLELVLSDRNVDLIEEGIDVAVRIGQLDDSSLITRRVGVVRRLTVASPAYLARRGAPCTPADLGEHDIVWTSDRTRPAEWRFGSDRGQNIVRFAPRVTVNDVEATLIALREGRGIGRTLSYQVADDLAAGRLVRLLRDFEPDDLPVQLLVPSARHMPPKVRAFLDHAVAELQRLPVLAELDAVSGPSRTDR